MQNATTADVVDRPSMLRSLDLADTLKEYQFGLNQKESIKSLETHLGNSWCTENKDKKFYNRRLPIYTKCNALSSTA